MFYDTDSKEAEIICLADDLERVLKVIGLTFLDIPEWGDWYQACERRKADLEEQLAWPMPNYVETKQVKLLVSFFI